jgi:hypothetical protein
MKSSKGKGNNKKVGTKKTTKKKKGSAKPSGGAERTPKVNRYRVVQKILSDFCKQNGKNLGKKFNKYASEIAIGEKDVPLKEIENNIEQIYLKYVTSTEVIKQFPNNFPFYEFSDKLLSSPTYDGVMIGVYFNDGTEEFQFKGNAGDMLDYYRLNMHKYFRANYNDSDPLVEFNIAETDSKTFVDYEVRVGQMPSGTPPPTPTPTPTPTPPTPPRPPEGGTTQADVDLARAKADEEKAKAIKLALEMLKDGLITKEDFADILKSLK